MLHECINLIILYAYEIKSSSEIVASFNHQPKLNMNKSVIVVHSQQIDNNIMSHSCYLLSNISVSVEKCT